MTWSMSPAQGQSSLMADIESRDGLRFFYETVNLSRTGVLVQGEQLFAPGTPFDFAFTLPFETRPVEGKAEVVRRVDAGRELMQGLGARFLTLRADGETRVQRFVEDGHGAPARPGARI
jgi:hypothetical protein